jgi:hypothetical protein
MTRKEMLPELSDLVFQLQEKGTNAHLELFKLNLWVYVFDETSALIVSYFMHDNEDELYTECINKLKSLLQ